MVKTVVVSIAILMMNVIVAFPVLVVIFISSIFVAASCSCSSSCSSSCSYSYCSATTVAVAGIIAIHATVVDVVGGGDGVIRVAITATKDNIVGVGGVIVVVDEGVSGILVPRVVGVTSGLIRSSNGGDDG